jgi:hypothetical protein
MDEIYLNTTQAERFYNCTRATLGNYARLGMPKAGRGRWPLFASHEWWIENIVGVDQGNGAPEASELSQAKLRWYEARAEAAEYKLSVEKGKYLSKDEIKPMWAGRVFSVVSALETLTDRLSAQLEGKSRGEISRILKSEVKHMRLSYAQEGKYTPSKRVMAALGPCLKKLYKGAKDDGATGEKR